MSPLLSQTDCRRERQHTQKPDGSLFTIAHVGKIDVQMHSKAYWTVAGEGLVAHTIHGSSSRQCPIECFS